MLTWLKIFYFDEIQNVSDWAKLIRRIHDTKSCEIFITGSSAKLLSKEIDTALRGRSLATEIYPFSFNESMKYKKNDTTSHPDHIRKYLFEFLANGGFPEVAFFDPDTRIKTLQSYVNIVVLKDIIERHQVQNETALRYMTRFLISNMGRSFSIHKCFKDLKSQGIRVSKNSLYYYSQYLEDAYLAFLVPLKAKSLRKQESNPKKIYTIDSGLTRAMHLMQNNASDWGRSFENLIFLDLKRQGYEVQYYLTREGVEIDLIASKPGQKDRAFQVSLEIDLNGKEELKKELGLDLEPVYLGNYLDFTQSL